MIAVCLIALSALVVAVVGGAALDPHGSRTTTESATQAWTEFA